MADESAPGGVSGSVPELASGKAAKGCRVPKLAACVLAALIGAAAAALLASFVPRGHRGRRRRPRAWHRGPAAVLSPWPADGRALPQEAGDRRR